MHVPPRLLFRHPAHFISLGFGSGLAPRMPGTVGTLLAWALFALFPPSAPLWLSLVILLALFILGVFAAGVTGRALGVADHGAIVWDEMVAMWLVLLFTPADLLWQAVAVALFRFFDILKPPPIRWADRHLRDGFGVMFDDLLAAGYSLLVLAVLLYFVG